MLCRLRFGGTAGAAAPGGAGVDSRALTPQVEEFADHFHFAPVAFEAGMDTVAEGWLREADAFFGAAGERPLQRKVRQTLAAIGVKVPRPRACVPAHLARLGITTRGAEILRLVNAGLSNADIAQQLYISIRTVETHVSSMLQKTGAEGRDQLPQW